MARLSDMPNVLRSVGAIPFTQRIIKEVNEDNLFIWAAALAYSWLFAIFPFLIFLLTLVPYLPEGSKERARTEIRDMIRNVFPGQAAETVWKNIDENLDNLLHEKAGKTLPRLAGLALALWGASGGMAMTMRALDICYELDRGRPFFRQRPLALGLTLLVAGLLILVVSLLPVGSLVKAWVIYHDYLEKGNPLLVVFDVARWTLSVIFMIAVVCVIYHKGPHVRHQFHWVTPGAVFSIVVWIVLGLAFRVYVTRFAKYNQTYGTVGGVVILLLFFYIDALVLLIGAEINSEVDFEVLKVKRGTRDFRKAEGLAAAGAPTSI